MPLLDAVVTMLAEGEALPVKYEDHPLRGKFEGCLTPDWLRIYEVANNELILYLARTGTHSDSYRVAANCPVGAAAGFV